MKLIPTSKNQINILNTETGFIATFIILVLSGCILTFSQFLCAAVSSALTASLVGVAKSVLQTLIGFFTFGGVPFHPLNILGQLKPEIDKRGG